MRRKASNAFVLQKIATFEALVMPQSGPDDPRNSPGLLKKSGNYAPQNGRCDCIFIHYRRSSCISILSYVKKFHYSRHDYRQHAHPLSALAQPCPLFLVLTRGTAHAPLKQLDEVSRIGYATPLPHLADRQIGSL